MNVFELLTSTETTLVISAMFVALAVYYVLTLQRSMREGIRFLAGLDAKATDIIGLVHPATAVPEHGAALQSSDLRRQLRKVLSGNEERTPPRQATARDNALEVLIDRLLRLRGGVYVHDSGERVAHHRAADLLPDSLAFRLADISRARVWATFLVSGGFLVSVAFIVLALIFVKNTSLLVAAIAGKFSFTLIGLSGAVYLRALIRRNELQAQAHFAELGNALDDGLNFRDPSMEAYVVAQEVRRVNTDLGQAVESIKASAEMLTAAAERIKRSAEGFGQALTTATDRLEQAGKSLDTSMASSGNAVEKAAEEAAKTIAAASAAVADAVSSFGTSFESEATKVLKSAAGAAAAELQLTSTEIMKQWKKYIGLDQDGSGTALGEVVARDVAPAFRDLGQGSEVMQKALTTAAEALSTIKQQTTRDEAVERQLGTLTNAINAATQKLRSLTESVDARRSDLRDDLSRGPHPGGGGGVNRGD